MILSRVHILTLKVKVIILVPKFKVCDHVLILKYKNTFSIYYTRNWSEEVFAIKKVKDTVPWIYLIKDLVVEKIVGTFYEKGIAKNKSEFKIKKIIKKLRDKLYVKWKGCVSSFNSWTDEKGVII